MSKEIYVKRAYKTVYKEGDVAVKVFTSEHGKANVFNEAICHARVEETGLNIPELYEVTKIDGEWALKMENIEGTTLQDLMDKNPDKLEEYMEMFVDMQLEILSKEAPRLFEQHYKFHRKISALREVVDATIRFELHTRLDAMENHHKLCHGDYNPSNVVVKEDGTMVVLDWSHATIGNASGDAAITYLELAHKNQKVADLYLNMFCKKADIAKQYVQKWMPIAAAVQMNKGNEDEKEYLMNCMDVIDFQ
ncbi:MAG: phosphotransferase [Schaedlerella sp.]|nr:phosphotransferase [Schaedlerella sp.]